MNDSIFNSIEAAIEQAHQKFVPITEIWMGPVDFEESRSSFTFVGGLPFFKGFRVRVMKENDLIRVGVTVPCLDRERD